MGAGRGAAIAWELDELGARAVPAPVCERAGDLVQVDLIGPRHLDGGARFAR